MNPRTTLRRVARVASLACAALLGASSAWAQSIDRLNQTVWGQVGLFRANVDSLVRLDYRGDPQLGIPPAGTTLDFEEDLGLRDTQSVAHAMLGVRLSERWRVELETYRLSRDGSKTLLDDSIVIDGVTYSASAQLRTRFDSRVQRLGLGYSFYKSDTAEAGLALGVQYTRYKLSFVGEGRFNNEPPEVRSVEESDKGPLPTLGLYGSKGFGNAWSASARVDYLPVDSKSAKGGLNGFEANVHYRITPHWSAALGYRVVEYKVTRKGSGELGGRFEYKFRGPQLLLEAGF